MRVLSLTLIVLLCHVIYSEGKGFTRFKARVLSIKKFSGDSGGGGLSRPKAEISSNSLPGTKGYTKGGEGPPISGGTYPNTRALNNNYKQTTSQHFSENGRSGWMGAYNPAMVYWAITPAIFYAGYYEAFRRFDPETGAYYAPNITTQADNPSNILINGTEYTSDEDNYHYTFNISTNNGYPMVDHAYWATSDFSASLADFAYRLTFSHVVEFDDVNQNGMFDPDQDHLLAVSSLQNAVWKDLFWEEVPMPTNSSLTYYMATSNATIPFNGSSSYFDVQFTWRLSNIRLNTTVSIPVQPNSLQYDFKVEGYPTTSARLALVQLVNTFEENEITFDVNNTTPIDVATQVRTNITYGISIGNYSEGRLEYHNKVNISDGSAAGWYTDLSPDNISASSYISPDDWIWGIYPPSIGISKLLFVSMPFQSENSVPVKNGTSSATKTAKNGKVSGMVSGLGFLDVDVMNAMAIPSSGLSNIYISSAAYTIHLFTTTVTFIILSALSLP
ncbi:hypothetical protein PHYBLDRAFT_66889 [Phycomyces blakesleeanus NRRL 1555(-)]|uniref:Uncharacterized protein n=1 Tax=Phycomyces blakesleeanus (strain ATCC 8743b / DSM 1359 / FGSC 10004 / NBRC 33097 / NRRL 1555) TaxID=763407 RepID=A0A162ZUQ5_PHYB8|nr:hypothetical protein PHYBLDRAFT_66889 [Phycomyces blakesleeanus NRRL 1555(-)]OAD69141.1 hypothetical protein PHYBLDRAFT_66889 [Phycomyces blakesleeanus NRRL 1555(-)]|eukprot:XP_018287181.1 hypothetical protein PHYBLDRAFT_66889 [Phycomyces blakesleeanus NRRL 1555(-)]